MNTIWIVLPILTVLMFDLGLTLTINDFFACWNRPRAVFVGLFGQIVLLPVIAFSLGLLFHIEPLFFVVIMLIACSPGGSSSNVFSMLAKGDVALSVILTALSSVITLFTMPIVMEIALTMINGKEEQILSFSMSRLMLQNILLMLLPIAIGICFRRYMPMFAQRGHRAISKMAFPALLLLATVFFVQHHHVIAAQITTLGGCILSLLLLTMGCGVLLSYGMRLKARERRTIIIEVGMQNAAQGIAIATSPFLFNNELMAIPSILYALCMNVVLLGYVGLMSKQTSKQVNE